MITNFNLSQIFASCFVFQYIIAKVWQDNLKFLFLFERNAASYTTRLRKNTSLLTRF